MNILGIFWGTCSSAALMVDGEIVASVSEERFSRKKNDESYPRQAIEAVLKLGAVSPDKIDFVAFAGQRFTPESILHHKYSSWTVQDRLREQREYWYPKMYEHRDVDYFEVFKDKLDTSQYPGDWGDAIDFLRNGRRSSVDDFFQAFRSKVVCRHLGIDAAKIVFPHHHRSHAYYAYYGSPIRKNKALILTADAWGDDMNASVSLVENGKVRMLSSSDNFLLARLYRSITLMLGMKPDEHEYKVMGLAAYAKPEYFQDALNVFKETMYADGLAFRYHNVPPDLYVYFRDRLEGSRFDAIAGALQHYCEDVLRTWARNCMTITGTRNVCFGGGVAMNVKATMEIAQLDEVEDLFVCPSPSDESLAMGACYVLEYDKCLNDGVDCADLLGPLRNSYLGPDLQNSDIDNALKSLLDGDRYIIQHQPALSEVAGQIAAGKIVGRCVDRSEFGARALGNRSIIADPRNIDVVREINEKIKSRDFWMPFAPSILEERASDYLMNPKHLRAPFMTVAFATTPLARSHLPAALHQGDFTCRPQIVSKGTAPAYHELISEFAKLTGVGAVLNTSFNIHGEPIVQTAADAVDVFKRSDMDGLLLDDYFIQKRSRNSI